MFSLADFLKEAEAEEASAAARDPLSPPTPEEEAAAVAATMREIRREDERHVRQRRKKMRKEREDAVRDRVVSHDLPGGAADVERVERPDVTMTDEEFEQLRYLASTRKSTSSMRTRLNKLGARAGGLPADLSRVIPDSDAVAVAEVDYQIEQHRAGAMIEGGRLDAAVAMLKKAKRDAADMDILTHDKPAEASAKASERGGARQKRQKPTEAQAREAYGFQEEAEVSEGIRTETAHSERARHEALSALSQPRRAPMPFRDEVVPEEHAPTLGHYRARDDCEEWMARTLEQVDKELGGIVNRLPGKTVNYSLLETALEYGVPFWEAAKEHYRGLNKDPPQPDVIDWDLFESLVREAIPERGERPCVRAESHLCESQKQFGFACRERMTRGELDRHTEMRLRDPLRIAEALPPIQRECICCALAVVQSEYYNRRHQSQHKDDESEYPDGVSEVADMTEIIADFCMDVHGPGQFDLFACHVGDEQFMGLLAPIIRWCPATDYEPETVSIASLSQADKDRQERYVRRKEALREQKRKRRAEAEARGEVFIDDSYWEVYNEVRRARSSHREEGDDGTPIVAQFQTPSRTPVPGMMATPGATQSLRQTRREPKEVMTRPIRRLRVLETLRFRSGATLVRTEAGNGYSRSTPTLLKSPNGESHQ